MTNRKNYVKSAIAALSGASMLALSLSPASAMTLPDPTLGSTLASATIELAGWHGGGERWGHGGYGGHGHWGYHFGWGHGYWGSNYWGYGHPPCSIYGGYQRCYSY